MLTIKLLLISIAMMALVFLALGVRVFFQKNGKFPHTHVGGNKELIKRGIYCAGTWDRIERKKVIAQYKKEAMQQLKPDPGFMSSIT
ncbi:MAG: hypothetical protein R6U85_03160 [Salinivirgaceae bacterium]